MNRRVLVAMSGGVDSSVAAALLHEQGYEVVGLTMKTWDHATVGGKAEARARAASGKQVGCCSLDAMNDARAVAVRLGFPHVIADLRAEFGGGVIDRFTSEYLAGRTPNPCVLCNTHVKWGALLRRADALGCDWIATGHYARVEERDGRHTLRRGADAAKDQSYALWGLPRPHLARSIFPLGDFTKPEVRQMATDRGLTEVSNKPDSYEICFVPEGDYRDFLVARVPGLAERVAGGPLVDEATGAVVGTHRGYPFYTVGQRRGLGVAFGAPAYVTRIDAATNTVFVGGREALAGRTLEAREVNWVGAAGLDGERPVVAQVRYNDRGAPALARQTGPDAFEVVFAENRPAITPGQAAVLYDAEGVVLAGGWIHAAGPAVAPRVEASVFLSLPVLS